MSAIPEGWKTDSLPSLLLLMKSGGTPDTSRSDYYGGEIPFVAIDDLTSCSKYLTQTSKKITKEGLDSSNTWIVPSDSILYSIYATLGVARINKIPVATNQAILAILNNPKKIDIDYLYYWLSYIRSFIENFSSQTTQSNLSATVVKSFQVTYPQEITEQSKIAEVLSTVDQAIEQTEEMIAKQQRIKTGLMQDLLTRGIDEDGNLRSEETHELVAFSELAEINPSRSKINDDDNTEVSFIPMVDVTESGRWINKQSRPYRQLKSGYTSFLEDDVLFAKITPCSENGKGCHAIGVKNGWGFASTEFHVLRAKKDADSSFIYQWSINLPLRLKAAAVMTGSAGQQRVPASFFYSYEIPKFSKSEQERIAKILSTVDNEIEKSEYIKKKLHSQKTALMQDLLTGRVRVTPLLKQDNNHNQDQVQEGASA